jgi:hypothetical protein
VFGRKPGGGYRDGMNLFEYIRSNPVVLHDVWGSWTDAQYDMRCDKHMPDPPPQTEFALETPAGGLDHYLRGKGAQAHLGPSLMAKLKAVDFYLVLINETIPAAIRSLIPRECCPKERCASAQGKLEQVGTWPIGSIGEADWWRWGNWGKDPNYSFYLNTTIGTINSIVWKVTCTVVVGEPTGKCCLNYAKNCHASFVLDDVYTFNTGAKDFLFQTIFGNLMGGQDFPIHNEWDEAMPDQTKLHCPWVK